MMKYKIFSVALLVFGSVVNAQDLEQAKKAIDAEQFEKAKGILKSLNNSSDADGKGFFMLGDIYFKQSLNDSAAFYFAKGLEAKKFAHYNYIGLGQLELAKANAAAAKSNFDKVVEAARRKDTEELVYIGRAYMNIDKPDYKTALVYLNKAKAIQENNAEMLLYLGDALYGDNNVNDAYSAYRNAYDADKSLLRANLQLGVLTKKSKAFQEAKSAFESILNANPSYGPAYRELAETYYLWALNDAKNFQAYNKKAIEYYQKYMSLTDYSLDSRMRHADFLILTKDYKALEVEANEMQKLDKVNPRILRYLGYSAFENGNIDGATTALNTFITTPNVKIIGRDYLYLGLAKTAKALTSSKDATGKDIHTVNETLFAEGVADFQKGITLDPVMANELNDIGKKFFDLKLYNNAAAIYEVAIQNPKSKNFLYDNFYLGYALYFGNANLPEGQTINPIVVEKGNAAFANVIAASPTTQDAYIYKARINSLLESSEAAQLEMVKNYEEFIKVVTAKGTEEMNKSGNKDKFVEAYNNLGSYYFSKDKAKAKSYFEQAIAINPTDEFALDRLKSLK